MLLTVVSQPAGGGSVTLEPLYSDNQYYPDDTVTLTAEASAGYVFVEWSGDVADIPDVTAGVVTVGMARKRTITASFVQSWVRYTLTAAAEPSAGGAVAVSPAQDNYTVNQVVTLAAAPAPGYAFSHWAGDICGTASLVDLRMNRDLSATAVFNPVLTARVESAGTGTVEADPPAAAGGYPAGTPVSLIARPAQGYLFDRWTGDADALSDPRQAALSLTMWAPLDLTARFVPAPRYSLDAAVQGLAGGSLSLEPAQPAGGYLAGTAVSLIARPAQGYVFSHWTGDACGTDPAVQLDISRALTVGAVFDPQVAAACDPAGGGEVGVTPPRESGGYQPGSEVTLEARAANGYRFASWSGDASGMDNPVTIVVDSPKAVTAVFERQFVFPWWAIVAAAAVALLILLGLPLEMMLRRKTEER